MGRTRRAAAGVVLAVAIGLLAGCGTVPTTGGPGALAPSASVPPEPSPEATATTASPPPTKPAGPPRTVTPTPKPKPKPKPAAVLERGDRGEEVRELQHRLRQLDWYAGTITGRYQSSTVRAVRGFQKKRKLNASGAVDTRTWSTLKKLTRTPTRAERHNALVPGPAILRTGSTGDRVRDLQARLKQIGWFSAAVSGTYGPVTATAVRGFQGRRAIPVTGEVDQRTLDRLYAMTRRPSDAELHNRLPKPSASGLDGRCLTGRAICISKRTNSLTCVIDGKPQLRLDVRFGAYETPTRNGSFSVQRKSQHWVSTIYHTPMPYSMFFSGGQAVHYSADFAARGYAGASHGCVNVRNYSGIASLFSQTRVGDKVIVY